VFQIGNKNDSFNQLTVTLDGMDTTDLGINSLSLATKTGAQAALTSIDTATDSLTSARGNIGAFQNRLSFASANLASMIENVQASESVIRDVDMAGEMTTFTANQILLQAGTAMLAQANMAPQLVLQLLG
jgi:flagellin